MHLFPTLLYVCVFGFPLMLIAIQWMLIRRRRPWIGMSVSLVFILIVVLVGFGVTKYYINNFPFEDWEGDGLGLLVIEGYAMVVTVISTMVGLLIRFIYRRWIWKPGEKIHRTGKIPSLMLMGVIVVCLVYFVLIMNRFT